MFQENWFATPIWYSYRQEDLSEAANKCMELKESGFPNRIMTNVGGWQSDHVNLFDFQEFRVVYDIISVCIQEVCMSVHSTFKCELHNVWININERDHYNCAHIHPGATLSGVLFLQCDENSGRIGFKNSESTKKHYPFDFYHETTVFSDYVYYTPKNGMSLIFPAWTEHFVETSHSDTPRISIAYNTKQVM